MKFEIDGVIVTSNLDDFSEDEARRYVDFVKARVSEPILTLDISLCDDGKIDVTYNAQGRKFERIRRITGYLTGDLNTWNDAKRSEEKERVKHGMQDFKE